MSLLLGWGQRAEAQVSVQRNNGEIVVTNAGFEPQRAVRGAGKTGGNDWALVDRGASYSAKTECTCPYGSMPIPGCTAYQSSDGVPQSIIDGYATVLQRLVNQHGAEIKYDPDLGLDLIFFPQAADPVAYFFDVITTQTLNGRYYIDYFKRIELNSTGAFEPGATAAKPGRVQYAFPNDPFYSKEWNLRRSRLAKAQWHPAKAKRAVRIGIIDSGIGAADRNHPGLDGTEIVHRLVAPTSGSPTPHALGIVSLLADRAQDGNGIVGLLGDSWQSYGGYQNAPLLSRKPPTIYSYNVGDFAPSAFDVARAIRRAIKDNVDVINLSVALAPTPSVEEAIQAALKKKIVIVAAAGNYDPSATFKPVRFPASAPGVIAVGAGRRDRTFADFSANVGVHLLAPGEDITQGARGDIWIRPSGTSFAAPHVVAAVAMMLAVAPDLKPDEVLDALQRYAQAKDKNGGVGFLSALSSLNSVLPRKDRVEGADIPLPETFSGGADDEESDEAGKTYADDYDPSVDAELFYEDAAPAGVPQAVALAGNYPNPFNPSTMVRFAVPEAQHVRLAVFNLLGQEVEVLADGFYEAGTFDVLFQADGLASGVYVARLETQQATVHRNMVLMK